MLLYEIFAYNKFKTSAPTYKEEFELPDWS